MVVFGKNAKEIMEILRVDLFRFFCAHLWYHANTAASSVTGMEL